MAKKRLAPHQLAMTFLIKGIPGVVALNEDVAGLTEAQIKNALEYLESRGAPTRGLVEWFCNVTGTDLRRGNRKAPAPGERRVYSAIAQSTSPQTAYLKVPLNVLGIQPGSAVAVTFESNRIIVTRN